MLEHVAEHDRVVVRLGQVGGEELLGADVEPELRARVVGGEEARLDPGGLAPAAGARLVEHEAHPAADVEDRAALGVALDPLEHAAEALALARLLVDVVVGGGLGVGARQLFLAREAVELHVAALGALDDVAERGAEILGRRDQAVLADLAADAQVGLERARPAGRADRGGGRGAVPVRARRDALAVDQVVRSGHGARIAPELAVSGSLPTYTAGP